MFDKAMVYVLDDAQHGSSMAAGKEVDEELDDVAGKSGEQGIPVRQFDGYPGHLGLRSPKAYNKVPRAVGQLLLRCHCLRLVDWSSRVGPQGTFKFTQADLERTNVTVELQQEYKINVMKNSKSCVETILTHQIGTETRALLHLVR
jgi:hypothetical protein